MNTCGTEYIYNYLMCKRFIDVHSLKIPKIVAIMNVVTFKVALYIGHGISPLYGSDNLYSDKSAVEVLLL